MSRCSLVFLSFFFYPFLANNWLNLDKRGGVDALKFNDRWGGYTSTKYLCSNNFPYYSLEQGDSPRNLAYAGTVSAANSENPLMVQDSGSKPFQVEVIPCNSFGCSTSFSMGETLFPAAPDLVVIRVTGPSQLSLQLVAPPSIASASELSFVVAGMLPCITVYIGFTISFSALLQRPVYPHYVVSMVSLLTLVFPLLCPVKNKVWLDYVSVPAEWLSINFNNGNIDVSGPGSTFSGHKARVGRSTNAGNHGSDQCYADDEIVRTVGQSSYNQLAVQCCNAAGSQGSRPGCQKHKTWNQAKSYCEGQQLQLCTDAQVAADIGAGSGCSFDYYHVWSSTTCSPVATPHDGELVGLVGPGTDNLLSGVDTKATSMVRLEGVTLGATWAASVWVKFDPMAASRGSNVNVRFNMLLFVCFFCYCYCCRTCCLCAVSECLISYLVLAFFFSW